MLMLSEEHVRQLLPMDECVDVMERLFQDAGAGGTSNASRYRMPLPNGAQQVMAGMSTALGAAGLKTSAGGGGRNGPSTLVLLYGLDPVEPLALISARALGAIRTGAASGIATKYMARPDAATVGIIGSGYQARTQLEALCCVRSVSQVWVFSRTAARRESFAHEMSESLDVPVAPVNSAEAAVAEADIVVTITNSSEPVVSGETLRQGTHINAAGGNHWRRRELDDTAVRRSGLIAVDDLPQARIEAGDLIWAHERRAFQWDQVVELGQVVSGRVQGRPSADAITLFESQGIGLEDVAAGMHVYRKAVEQGLGQRFEL
jgi:alanine dehydrogenase